MNDAFIFQHLISIAFAALVYETKRHLQHFANPLSEQNVSSILDHQFPKPDQFPKGSSMVASFPTSMRFEFFWPLELAAASEAFCLTFCMTLLTLKCGLEYPSAFFFNIPQYKQDNEH